MTEHWISSNTDRHRWIGVGANEEYLITVVRDVNTDDYIALLEFSTHGAGFTVSIGRRRSLDEMESFIESWMTNHDPLEPGDLEGYLGL